MKRLWQVAALAVWIAVWIGLFASDGDGSTARPARVDSAWGTTYFQGLSAPLGTPVGEGIIAIKTELHYNGFDVGMNLETAGFGKQAAVSARNFQAANGLFADAVVGPITARFLLRKRAFAVEAVHAIPNHYLARLKSLESANDPAAVGFVDPDDHGPVQINLRIHSGVTLAQATAPSWCFPWAGQALFAAFNAMHDWEGAVASWNTGTFFASRWVAAGKPSQGLVVNGIDWYARASHYIELLKAQPF